MQRHRVIALTVSLLAFIAFVLSAYSLAAYIARYNDENPPNLIYIRPIDSTQNAFAGKPLTIEDTLNDQGFGTVTVTFGDNVLELPVQEPVETPLPDLAHHGTWLRLIAWKRGDAFDADDARDDKREGIVDGAPVLVVRRVPPGEDPRTVGRIARSQWRFSFYEFMRDGTIERSEFQYPESRRAYQRRVRAAERAGEPAPTRPSNELQQDTWQFSAAMLVMPGRPPSQSFTENALAGAGWRWPATTLSFIIACVAFVVGIAPKRRTAEDDAKAQATA